jgi:NAD(P)-dependent dehydrogenase (short-subunit alcohol dehydrogenase family)
MQGDAKIPSGMSALVTEAGQGLGLGIALALANEGCNIAVNHKDDCSKLEAEEG